MMYPSLSETVLNLGAVTTLHSSTSDAYQKALVVGKQPQCSNYMVSGNWKTCKAILKAKDDVQQEKVSPACIGEDWDFQVQLPGSWLHHTGALCLLTTNHQNTCATPQSQGSQGSSLLRGIWYLAAQVAKHRLCEQANRCKPSIQGVSIKSVYKLVQYASGVGILDF